jgi:hypothetical protein
MKTTRRDFVKKLGVGIAGLAALASGLPVLKAEAKAKDYEPLELPEIGDERFDLVSRSKGFVYSGEYRTDSADRGLIDKEYVDKNFSPSDIEGLSFWWDAEKGYIFPKPQ